jgi:hypothetical protein
MLNLLLRILGKRHTKGAAEERYTRDTNNNASQTDLKNRRKKKKKS